MIAGSHKDLAGKQFGKLTVMSYAGKSKTRHSLWKCRCLCGKQIVVLQSNLVGGKTNSCGCSHKDYFKHRLIHTRLYRIWTSMKTRCHNPNCKSYPYYGSRGITVCPEWKNDFQAFHNWAMSHGYSDNLSIDRIDNDKGYFPDNCRWATTAEQNKNRRCVKKCYSQKMNGAI